MGGETTPSTSAAQAQQSVHIQLDSNFEYAAYKTSDNTAKLVCQLTAPECEVDESRPGVDIVTVFDVSGSMGGEKLKLAIETLQFMIANLKPSDRFGLVTFDSNIYTNFKLIKMDQAGKNKANAIVKKLRAGSCTNLSGGLFEGIKMMQARTDKAAVASVLLMTDGLANGGIRDVNPLCTTMKSLIGEAPEFSTYCFGYGKDHDSNMLQMISEIGNGMYYFIESNDTIAQSFGDCLGGLLTVVGQNINLKIEAIADGYVVKKVYSNQQATITAGGTLVSVTLGDLQAEETRDILIEVDIPVVVKAHEETRPVFAFTINYVNVLAQGMDAASTTLSLSRPKEVPAGQEHCAMVRDAIDRQRTIEGIDEARQLAEAGRLDDARKRISATRAHVACNSSSFASVYMDDLDECAANMASTQVFKSQGMHQMASAVQSHAQQRSNRVWAGDEGRGGYVTKKKMAMRGK